MLLNAAVLMMLAQADGDKLPTAADAMAAAHGDLAKLPLEARRDYRYLSLHNLDAKQRVEFAPIAAGHCNQLSRTRLIEKPAIVAGGMLLRINLQHYGWTAELWEKTLSTDPYFTVTVERVEEQEYGYYDARGAWVRTRVEKKGKKQQAVAPWLADSPEAKVIAGEVATWTGSVVPCVRCDWFFNQTATAADGRHYYEFIGATDRKSFEEAGGFDRKLFEKFRLPLREAVAISGVTLQPRALVFFDSAGGGYTFSVDFLQAKGKKNPLTNLGKDIEGQGDAFEAFILGPNGFWRTALYNAKGELQATAPPDIAGDHFSPSNDKRVHANVSCTRCHQKGGMQDVDAWVRNLLNPPLELRTTDYEKYAAAREEYLSDLSEFIDRTRGIYERAVKRATGLDSAKYAVAYGRMFADYEDRRVTTEIASRDYGLSAPELRKRILETIKSGYPVSPTASVFVHEGKRASAVGIRQYEEIVPELYQVVRRSK